MKCLKFALMGAVLALAPVGASASVIIDVGYADNLRASPFFPIPFIGDANTVTWGSFGSDNGLVGIDNRTGSAAVTVSSFSYTINYSGSTPYSGTFTVPKGDFGIIVLGDTSDVSYIAGATYGHLASGCSAACPTVTLDLGSGVKTYNDSGHVLDTGGFDFASNGSNESFQWREIGTTGGQAAPEPSTWAMMMLGFAGLGFAAYRSSRKTVPFVA